MSDAPPRPNDVLDYAAPAALTARRATIGSRLTARENNFDFIRLVAAVFVIVSHSWPLRDGDSSREPYFRLGGYCSLGEVSVATFFVISGLLVARSYLTDPSPTAFLRKRFLRILPALVVCVAFCIFIVGPLFTQLGLRDYFLNKATFRFSRNAILYPSHYYELPGVFSQFHNDPREAVNGSLWSLPIEFFMYLGVLALGVMRLLPRKWCLIALSTLLLLQWLAIERILHASPEWQDAHSTLFAFVDKYQVWLDNFAQLGFLFFAGTLMLLYKDSIVLDWRIFAACLLLVAIGWRQSIGYFLFVVCLPYIVMYLAFVPARALQSVTKRGDFSYGVYLYGYPVQQMLMRTWGHKLPFAAIIGVSCAGALLLAMLSWHVVEKPFLKLKRRSSRGVATPALSNAPDSQRAATAGPVLERQVPLVEIH